MARSYYWPQQSPIDLSTKSSYYVDFKSNLLQIMYQGEYRGSFQPHGDRHDFILSDNPGGQTPPKIVFNGKSATLKKIHLHVKSEHNVDDNDLPGEIHLVNQTDDSNEENPEYIVIGVFFDTAKSEGSKESKLTASLKNLSKGFQLLSTEFEIDPKVLIASHEKWYWYYGSLTSPPYKENVTWVVLHEHLTLDSDDFQTIKENALQLEREIQALDRRFVLRNFE